MSEESMPNNDKNRICSPVTLRTVADRVGLAPCSVSAVLNNTPAATAIPQRTKERILRAAKQLNYRPNLAARSLRTRRTHTVALMASDLGNVRVARLISGVEAFLRESGYLLVITTCDRNGDSAQAAQFLQRGIEGVITIDATPPRSLALPLVFIDLPYSDVPEPITHLRRERLTAMGEAAAQSLLAQIEQKTGYLTRVALSPEPSVGLLPSDAGISIHRLTLVERFAD
jgi:DNA-binding LacI/PurR family transcriptional regulator